MIISDTHTHLYLKEFDSDRDQVINNAITSNVSRLFLPAIDSSHTQSMLILKKKFPKNIFLMAGLHPCYIGENYLEELEHVEKNIIENQCIQRQEVPEDLVGTIMFLASEASAFVTGQTILVNGGLTFR